MLKKIWLALVGACPTDFINISSILSIKVANLGRCSAVYSAHKINKQNKLFL